MGGKSLLYPFLFRYKPRMLETIKNEQTWVSCGLVEGFLKCLSFGAFGLSPVACVVVDVPAFLYCWWTGEVDWTANMAAFLLSLFGAEDSVWYANYYLSNIIFLSWKCPGTLTVSLFTACRYLVNGLLRVVSYLKNHSPSWRKAVL